MISHHIYALCDYKNSSLFVSTFCMGGLPIGNKILNLSNLIFKQFNFHPKHYKIE